jgi:hypothetical protein
MARVTYNDPSGVAETVNWHGREHKAGEPVDVEDAPENQAYLDAAEANPFFTVEDRQELEQEGDNAPPPVKYENRKLTPFERGQVAKQDGKERSIPVYYRGKDEAEEWLQGYDSDSPVSSAPVADHPTSEARPGPLSPGSSSSLSPPQGNGEADQVDEA